MSESNFLSVRRRLPRRISSGGGEGPPAGEDESPRDAHDDDDVVERHPGHVDKVHGQDLVPELSFVEERVWE